MVKEQVPSQTDGKGFSISSLSYPAIFYFHSRESHMSLTVYFPQTRLRSKFIMHVPCRLSKVMDAFLKGIFFQLPIPCPTSLHQCFFSTISSRRPCWLQWHHICLWTDILRKNTYYGGEDSDFHEGWGAGSDVGKPRNLSERRARIPGLPVSEVAGSWGWTEWGAVF